MESLFNFFIAGLLTFAGLYFFFISIQMTINPERFTSARVKVGKKSGKIQVFQKDGVRFASIFMLLASLMITMAGIAAFFFPIISD